MVEKVKLAGNWSMKNWVAAVLFGAIIIVFALWGVDPNQYGDQTTGGVAAVVNDTSIPLAEFRNRVDSVEQNMRLRMGDMPEPQRRAMTTQIRRQALEELILGEVVYQAASARGVHAADAEVRDYILQIPFLQENGRFQKDRYYRFLEQMSLSTDEFERQIRKQIVNQKLQELFVGSAAPTREELRRNRLLANQKVSIRFAEITKDDLNKTISDADVRAYQSSNAADIEKYYKDNAVEFTQPEKVKARHILVRIDDKRPEAEAMKLAAQIRKEATPANFAKLAAKHSDDPGSKDKGGDLGEFDKGRMVPEFEKAAFDLPVGQISDPVKTAFGYHILLVEKKSPARTEPLEAARDGIARKLFARAKESELVTKLKETAKSNLTGLNAQLAQAGVKWQDSGEFDLSSSSIPKLGDAPELIRAILKTGRAGGYIPELIESNGRYLVAEVVSWKEVPDKTPDVEGLERMVAFRKSSDLIETWSKDVEAKAKVQRNSRIVQ